MLEKLPHAVGHALQGLSPGPEKTAYHGDAMSAVPATIRVESPAFADGGAIPERFTDDGDGVSPPLSWSGVPAGAEAVALLVEDADSPTPSPLVHAIVWNHPGGDGGLPEGAIATEGGEATGRNSFLGAEWLPPDPPPGHGPHRYLFQVYALDRPLDLSGTPGRSALLSAMEGHVVAKGLLTGTFERP